MKANFLRQYKITMRSFQHWVRARLSNQARFFTTVRLRLPRAMQRSGVRRLVALSVAAHFPGIPNRIVSFILRSHMRDSLAMEKVVQDSGLDWTIARPPRLTREQYATYRSREGAAPRRGFSVSRKAVEAFMLDAIEQKKHFQKIVGIAK